MKLPILSDLDISGKRLLIRQDLNVPMNDGRVTSDARIRAALPTLQYALAHGAQVMVMSHLGRPKEGVALQDQTEVSLAPVAKVLEQLLGQSVPLVDHYLDGLPVTDAAIVLLENIRMNVGEKANDAALSKQLAGSVRYFCDGRLWHRPSSAASTAVLPNMHQRSVLDPYWPPSCRHCPRLWRNLNHRLLRLSGGVKSHEARSA